MKSSKLLFALSFLSLLVVGCNKNDSISLTNSASNFPLSNSISVPTSNSTSNTLSPSSASNSVPSTPSTSVAPSTSASSSTISKYKVSINKSDDFIINGLNDIYEVGVEVTFNINVTNANKKVKEVKANNDILAPNNDTYSFIMPNIDVTINVSLIDKDLTALQTAYEVKYKMPGKTAKKLDNATDIFNTFELTHESGIITEISDFELVYGGGNGGSGNNRWYSGDMLKLGTTSANGSVTFSLSKSVTQVKVSGYAYVSSGKLRIGDSASLDWEGTNTDNKTIVTTCEGLEETSKEVIESKNIKQISFDIPSTKSLKIATTNKKPLFITGIEFVVDPNEKPDVPKKEYNVTWLDENGDVLNNEKVKEGETPIYKGSKPTKEGTDSTIYVFSGWMPKPTPINGDTTYRATYTSYDKDKAYPSSVPTLSSDNKVITYGYYPQTVVSDNDIISALNDLAPINANEWYLYDNEYYIKEVANVYNNEKYTFDNGNSIINGNEYWFKVEPIKWNIINNADGNYYLLSSKLLDAHKFYENYENRTIDNNIVLPNNYEYSDVRNWLNDKFYSMAFTGNNEFIQEKSIVNDKLDKVFLPSKDDYLNINYGFDNDINEPSITREAKTTDYARARGAWYNTTSDLKYNGSYWTRSSTDEYSYCAWNVNSSGYLSKYAIDGNNHSIRPAIQITLKNN